jgi:hypothetical protein
VSITGDDKPEIPGELFESMFRNVPVRPRPPEDIEKTAFRRFREDWYALHARGIRRKRVVYWAMAASVLVVLLIQPVIFQLDGKSDALLAVGKVEKHRGNVAVLGDGKRTDLKPGDPPFELFPMQSLLTGNGAGLFVQWGGHKTVRVDQNTRLNLLSGNEIELVTGQIYVDVPPRSGSSSPDGNLRVVTRFGTISHHGTQFMVSADDAAVEVRVREGTVTLESGTQNLVSHQGERTSVSASGEVSSSATSIYGDGWQWAEKLSPGFALEGSKLVEFLTWVHRETGKELVYETDAAKDSADSTVLHGSVVDLEPMLSLDLVLQTTEMAWYEKDGTIHLSVGH